MQNIKTKKRQNQKNKERKTQQTYSNKWPMSKRTCQKTGKIDVQGCWKKTRMIENREKGQTYTESKNNNVQNRNKLTTELKQQMD